MRIKQRMSLLLVFSFLTSLGIIVNSLYFGSQLLGILFTLFFFASIGVVCGKVLFDDEPSLLKAVKGCFVFVIILTISGTLLLLLDMFTMIYSMLLIVAIAAVFWVLLIKKTRSSSLSVQTTEGKTLFSVEKSQLVLSSLVIALVLISFYILWISRTAEPMFDVWQTISSLFFLAVSASSFFLVYSLFRGRNSSLQLVLIMFTSFLFESIYYLVWYPSTYGDPLTSLGRARFVLDTGRVFSRENILSQGLLLDFFKGRAYNTFIVQLTRMLNCDIYWVHNIVIPLLWAIIIPISLYEITCLLINKPLHGYPKTAILAAFSGAFLIPLLVMWGAAPTPNTLSFIFLFFSLSMLLRWLQTGKRFLLGLVVVTLVATGLTHPFPGIIAGVFLLISLIFRFVKNGILKGVLIVGSFLVYPIAVGYESGFVLENMLNLQNFLGFEGTILTIHLLVAGLGFLFLFRQKGIDRRIAVVLFIMWLVVVSDYYVTQFGVISMRYGPGRILAVADFLLATFVGLGLSLVVLSIGKVTRMSSPSIIAEASKRLHYLRSFSIVILCLIIALQSVATLYQAYPVEEVELAPTWYEIEAVYYINSTAIRPFAVVSDTLFSNIAIGLLGESYSYAGEESGGGFGLPHWEYFLQDIYSKMTKKPSLTLLKTVQDAWNVTQVYFVLSVRLKNFASVLGEMLELLPAEKTFGDEKLYVFNYMPKPVEGYGPMVSVTFDNDTTAEVQSRYWFEIQEEVTYSINLTGHSSYNITSFPEYWVFNELRVNNAISRFDNTSDVNSFVFKSGLDPGDTLEVKWFANEFYKKVGWKEDSFLRDWGPYPRWTYPIEPKIKTDGDILSISWNFTPGQDENYYYAKPANLSTYDYPFVIVRWRSLSKVMVVGVYYEVGFQEVVRFGSGSYEWTTTVVELPRGKNIKYVMIGIADYEYLTEPTKTSVSVDYVLIVAET